MDNVFILSFSEETVLHDEIIDLRLVLLVVTTSLDLFHLQIRLISQLIAAEMQFKSLQKIILSKSCIILNVEVKMGRAQCFPDARL